MHVSLPLSMSNECTGFQAATSALKCLSLKALKCRLSRMLLVRGIVGLGLWV